MPLLQNINMNFQVAKQQPFNQPFWVDAIERLGKLPLQASRVPAVPNGEPSA